MFSLTRTTLRTFLQREDVSAVIRNISDFKYKFGVLGVPFEKGQVKHGVSRGPEAMRKHGIIEELKTVCTDLMDYGDVNFPSVPDTSDVKLNMKHLKHVAICHEEVSKSVQNILNDGRICITLGGDHSISIGTVDGHVKAKGDVALLWVDAHADLNTADTSPTGNVHGMPVALIVKELSDYWPYIPGMDWQMPRLSVKNIAYIGLRSIDNYERVVLDKFAITSFGMEDIERLGIVNVTAQALNRINPTGTLPLHVSFDIDSLDCLEAPSTGTAVRGGMTLREGIQVMEEAYRTGCLSAVDLVEVNPAIGDTRDVNTTLDAAKHILKAAVGYLRRGRYPDNLDHLRKHTNNYKE